MAPTGRSAQHAPSPGRIVRVWGRTLGLSLGAACLLGLGACSGIEGLDGPTGGGGGPPALNSTETASVRGQVDKAVAARRWKVAWNQEIEAGADRERLEAIAVGALGDRSRHAEDMLDALRARHGALSPTGRAQVDSWAQEAQAEGHWLRAVTLELQSADDPPAYVRAWAVYRAAPVEIAPDLLEAITDAREAHMESSAAPGEGR